MSSKIWLRESSFRLRFIELLKMISSQMPLHQPSAQLEQGCLRASITISAVKNLSVIPGQMLHASSVILGQKADISFFHCWPSHCLPVDMYRARFWVNVSSVSFYVSPQSFMASMSSSIPTSNLGFWK